MVEDNPGDVRLTVEALKEGNWARWRVEAGWSWFHAGGGHGRLTDMVL